MSDRKVRPVRANSWGRALGIAAVLAILILAGLLVMIRQAGGSIYFDTGPSKQLLSALADSAKWSGSADSAVSRTPADGTTADTAFRDYRISKIESARSAIVKACGRLGLSLPSATDRKIMPDIVCQGRWQGHDATVHLNGRCNAACLATLEVRII